MNPIAFEGYQLESYRSFKFVINLAEDSLKLVTANIAFRPFDIGTFRQNFTWKVYSEDDRYPTFQQGQPR